MPSDTASTALRRSFKSRADLTKYLKTQFPLVAARGDAVGAIKGGRRAAERALKPIDPVQYGRTRSSLEGAVTRLSPYIRHGVVTLAEVRDAVLNRSDPRKAYKLLSELSWRDYYQRVYAALGDGIWADFEPYKTGRNVSEYASSIPDDLRTASTGAVCIDSFAHQLERSGYLHNHVRMWLSAYVVHWRRVSWQAGAGWFLEHLLDGDPASNALGWQWVASTWRRYPYIWNRGNLVKYAGMRYCERCPLYESGCPFAGTYAALSQELFTKPAESKSKDSPLEAALASVPDLTLLEPANVSSEFVLVWMHGDALSPLAPALQAYPDASAVYVWDDALLETYQLSLKRLLFLYECLLELPVTIHRGDPVTELIRLARDQKRTVIATTHSVAPKFKAICEALESSGLTVQIFAQPPFAELSSVGGSEGFDLRSHASYYRAARKGVERLGGVEPTPAKPRVAKPQVAKPQVAKPQAAKPRPKTSTSSRPSKP